MQYQISLESKSKDNFIASVVGMSNLMAEGTTEEEALQNITAALEATLSTGKFVQIEVQEANSLSEMKFAGIFADDQTFDDFMEKLRLIREKANQVREPL